MLLIDSIPLEIELAPLFVIWLACGRINKGGLENLLKKFLPVSPKRSSVRAVVWERRLFK